jgi:hypothetical protein
MPQCSRLETQQEKAWVMGSGLHTIKETNHDRDESDEGGTAHPAHCAG